MEYKKYVDESWKESVASEKELKKGIEKTEAKEPSSEPQVGPQNPADLSETTQEPQDAPAAGLYADFAS